MNIAKLLFRKPGRLTELPQPPADRTMLGVHAERLLNDPVLHLAFDRVADKLHTTWLASAADDDKGRERVYMQRKALERVRGELTSILGDRKVIEKAAADRDAKDARERERRAA